MKYVYIKMILCTMPLKNFIKINFIKKYQSESLALTIKKFSDSCDIFYSAMVDENLLKKINNNPLNYTLYVCDTVDKLYLGFVMALYIQEKKIKIAINQEALLKTELSVDYRLLKAATQIINPVEKSNAF
ncbi:MAG: YfiR/HmsC family protein [Sulfurimonas sp.]|nr:YfiR/HmsC family protein [Sulfurimonas sp.]